MTFATQVMVKLLELEKVTREQESFVYQHLCSLSELRSKSGSAHYDEYSKAIGELQTRLRQVVWQAEECRKLLSHAAGIP